MTTNILTTITACILSAICIISMTGCGATTGTNEPVITQEEKENISKLTDHNAHTHHIDNIADNTLLIRIDGVDYDLFKRNNETTWVFWDFYQTGTVGSGKDTDYFNTSTKFYQNSENVFFSEGYFGITATIDDDRTLTVKPTTNYENNAVLTDIKLTDGYFANKKLAYEYNSSTQTLTADLYDSSYQNGIYAITGTYLNQNETVYCNLYMLVNCATDKTDDYEFYICKGAEHGLKDKFNPYQRHEFIQNLLTKNNCSPEKTTNSRILYPSIVTDYTDGDTDYWIKKSYEILQKYPEASDDMKILLFHDWITSHLTYDNYDINELSSIRRYWTTNDTKTALCADKEYYVSKTKTGICSDYASIFVIMCREHDIPCAGISTDHHVWNVVYLHNQWIEIDITPDVQRFVNDFNYNNITGTDLYHYTGFCTDYVNELTPEYVNRFIKNI